MGYKYNPDPKWRLTYYNKETDTLMEKEFRTYTEISNDDVWNKIVKNKDFLHNHHKRLKPNKKIIVKKLR